MMSRTTRPGNITELVRTDGPANPHVVAQHHDDGRITLGVPDGMTPAAAAASAFELGYYVGAEIGSCTGDIPGLLLYPRPDLDGAA